MTSSTLLVHQWGICKVVILYGTTHTLTLVIFSFNFSVWPAQITVQNCFQILTNQILTTLWFPNIHLSPLFIQFSKMAGRSALGFFLFWLGFSKYLADDSQRVLRFEYKFSFKGPHLINKQGQVPFWAVGGSKCKICCLSSL